MNQPVVGIVGLGLVGGSLARDLHARGLRVLGHDTQPLTLAAALDSGVVAASLGDRLENVGHTDWLVIAVPVDAAKSVLERIRRHADRLQLITDVGSTKRDVMNAAASLGLGRRFVGSHPLAGDQQSGWRAARQGLFTDQRVYLCAGEEAEASALHAARALWRLCGARTEMIGAAEHDRLLAWTSHLPQLLSSALASALSGAGIPPLALGRGGRDMTRLAASSAEVWTPIALQNADALCVGLGELQNEIRRLREMLRAGEYRRLRDFFAAAHEWTSS